MSIVELVTLVVGRLRSVTYPWAITGSGGLMMHGLDVDPGDIDIQSTAEGIYVVEQALEAKPVFTAAYRASDRIRSHFGRYTLGGWQVELMGGVEKRDRTGQWQPTPPLSDIVEWVHYNGVRAPVLSLESELAAYTLLGRTNRCEQIAVYLEHRSSDS